MVEANKTVVLKISRQILIDFTNNYYDVCNKYAEYTNRLTVFNKQKKCYNLILCLIAKISDVQPSRDAPMQVQDTQNGMN